MAKKNKGLKSVINTRTGRRVQVRSGAIIYQDFHNYKWINKGQVFTIEAHTFGSRDRCILVAEGYGQSGNYGNGSIIVNKQDLRA